MIATRVSALALAAALGVAAAAYAQSPPAQRPPVALGGATWAPGSQLRHEAHEAHQAAHMKALHEALNIRPDQEGAFQAFAASMRSGDHDQRAEDMGREPQATAGMTTPERVDAMGRMMDEHMARMRERFQRHATAVKAFYAVLSPEQRRTLDALPELTGHGMGMGMGHHGDMDKPGMGMEHSGEHE